MSYLGNSPGVASQRVVTNRVANEGQIRISADSGYVKGYVDVIINGTDMVAGVDFTEVGDGINVDMAVPLNSGDTIKLVSWIPRGLTDGYLKSEADALMTQTLGLSNFRNRIINGDMKISQRGTSFAPANGYILDRFIYSVGGSTAVATVTQNTDVPAGSGLSNSLRVTVTTADTTIVGSDYATINQYIEGYNVADLVGVPITLSFWVRSSKTGVHCIKLRNTGADKAYVSEYTINTANTWEKKYITVSSGLPSDGTWNFTNGVGLSVQWALAVGPTSYTTTPNTWMNTNLLSTSSQVNCLDTVGNIFAITGVQLEKGSSATDFEFRPYSVELALCQRYYELVGGVSAPAKSIYTAYNFMVQKRTSPTVSIQAGSLGGADLFVFDNTYFTCPNATVATSTINWIVYASAEL